MIRGNLEEEEHWHVQFCKKWGGFGMKETAEQLHVQHVAVAQCTVRLKSCEQYSVSGNGHLQREIGKNRACTDMMVLLVCSHSLH